MSAPNGSLPTEESLTPTPYSPTAFTELKEIFPKYDTEKLKTKELIEGCLGVVKLIERFGKVFAPVVFDMNRNIERINAKFKTDQRSFEFIEDMILSERDANNILVIDAIQWLRRGLHFIERLFHLIIENYEDDSTFSDLTPILKRAYCEALEIYHGWLGTQLFN